MTNKRIIYIVLLVILSLSIGYSVYYLKSVLLRREEAVLDKCFCDKFNQDLPFVLEIIPPRKVELQKNTFVAISFTRSCNIKIMKAYIRKNNAWKCFDTLRSCDRFFLINTGNENSVFFKLEGYDASNNLVIADSIKCQLSDLNKTEYSLIKVQDSTNFYPRDGAVSVEFNGKLFLVGGWHVDNTKTYTNNEIWTSADSKNWSLISNAPFTGRHCFGLVNFKNALWVVGGDCNNGYCQKDVWKSFDGVCWSKIADVEFLDRANYSLVVFRNKLWLFGGQKMPMLVPSHEYDEVYNDAWSTEDGINWKNESSHLNWTGRGVYNRIVSYNDCLYLLGGHIYQAKTYNDVWKSVDGINWIRISKHSPWKAAGYSDAIVYDQKIWIVGGFVGRENINEVWYSDDAICWKQLKSEAFPSRHAASLVVYKNNLYIIAGNLKNDVWRISKVEH